MLESVCASMPSCCPRASASATPAMLIAKARLLHTLAAWNTQAKHHIYENPSCRSILSKMKAKWKQKKILDSVLWSLSSSITRTRSRIVKKDFKKQYLQHHCLCLHNKLHVSPWHGGGAQQLSDLPDVLLPRHQKQQTGAT